MFCDFDEPICVSRERMQHRHRSAEFSLHDAGARIPEVDCSERGRFACGTMHVAGARRQWKRSHDHGGQREHRGSECPSADGTPWLAPPGNRRKQWHLPKPYRKNVSADIGGREPEATAFPPLPPAVNYLRPSG
jgi:hypothetical protein